MSTREGNDLQSYFDSGPSISWTGWALFIGTTALLLLVGNLAGCAANKTTTKVPTYVEAKKQVLAQGPLVKPPVEERFKFPAGRARGVKAGTVVTTTDGTKIKWGSVVLDDPKVQQLAAIKAERKRLRKELEAEKVKSRVQKMIYDKTLELIREKTKPTWWSQNKWTILGPTLLAIGSALTVAIMYAVTGGKGLTITTNAHVLPPVSRGAVP